MYMQASFKKAQRLHISHRGGPGHVGSPSFLWHRVTLLNTYPYSATSTTLRFAKRTTLCFCTAFRDILSLHIAHAFRFAWFAYHHSQNHWFSLRHGQYTLIFRSNFFCHAHGYTDYLFIHYEASGRANPVIIGPLFSCRVFLPNCQAKYTVSRCFYTPSSVMTLLISWASHDDQLMLTCLATWAKTGTDCPLLIRSIATSLKQSLLSKGPPSSCHPCRNNPSTMIRAPKRNSLHTKADLERLDVVL